MFSLDRSFDYKQSNRRIRVPLDSRVHLPLEVVTRCLDMNFQSLQVIEAELYGILDWKLS